MSPCIVRTLTPSRIRQWTLFLFSIIWFIRHEYRIPKIMDSIKGFDPQKGKYLLLKQYIIKVGNWENIIGLILDLSPSLCAIWKHWFLAPGPPACMVWQLCWIKNRFWSFQKLYTKTSACWDHVPKVWNRQVFEESRSGESYQPPTNSMELQETRYRSNFSR